MNQSTSGFTFIKDGLNLGYPIKESIQSISDLCDEHVLLDFLKQSEDHSIVLAGSTTGK